MLHEKIFRNFLSTIFIMGTLLSFSSKPVYGAYAEFTFDMPSDDIEFRLPLVFEENGVILNAYSDSTYWRQTSGFTEYFFPWLSGGVLTNGVRVAAYPAETLSLSFSTGMTNFSVDFAIDYNGYEPFFPSELKYFGLIAYSGTNTIGGAEKFGLENGSIELSLSLPFDRIDLYSSDMVDFAIDNVRVSNIPLPSSFILLASGIFILLFLRIRWGISLVAHEGGGEVGTVSFAT